MYMYIQICIYICICFWLRYFVVGFLLAIHCNTLHHAAIHRNSLQHTAPHCNTGSAQDRPAEYHTLQHTAHTATYCITPQHTAIHCNILQHAATHRTTLQHRKRARQACRISARSVQWLWAGYEHIIYVYIYRHVCMYYICIRV